MGDIREFTDQQFQDGSSVDGNRVDAALDGLVRAFNQLEPRWQEYIWTERRFVVGYIPVDKTNPGVASQPSAPWMAAGNRDDWLVPAGTEATNPYRNKGYAVPGIDYAADGKTVKERHWIWETSHYFDRPVIIDQLCWWLHTDNGLYGNAFQYGSPPPPERTDEQFVQDIEVEISVDNPFTPEHRSQGALVFHRTNFSAASVLVNPDTIAWTTDMEPTMPPAPSIPQGLCIHERDLNIPIPRDSRVRWSICLPEYDAAKYTTSWNGDKVLQSQWYSGCLVIREAVL